MRKIISMICAATMTLAGVYLLYWQVFQAQTIRDIYIAGAGFLLAIGGVWLSGAIKALRARPE